MASVRAARIPELRTDPDVAVRNGSVAELARFLDDHHRIAVLTGAGCSTGSGIPAYRDESGRWRRRQPIFYQDFINNPVMRRRYWARSYFGWSVMQQARPGPTHTALAALADSGKIAGLITQNVDGLHQRAGHRALIELHGGLERVLCLDCGLGSSRDALQQRLEQLNPDWAPEVLGINPDGDAELDAGHDKRAYPGFRIAACPDCGGTLKPDVVFFGESVPRQRLAEADRLVEGADAMLIVGTSLVVWSGFRLARLAAAREIPIVAINNGLTRADALLQFKLQGDCGEVLEQAVAAIRPASAQGQ
ncbi:MAG: NAD-dependent protein deacetylase [Wenzhouxiangellaceae bacterium]